MRRELTKDVWAAELAANRQTSTPATNGFARIRQGTRMRCTLCRRIYTKSTRRSPPSAGMVRSLFRWTADASLGLCSRRAMRDECSTAQRLAFNPTSSCRLCFVIDISGTHRIYFSFSLRSGSGKDSTHSGAVWFGCITNGPNEHCDDYFSWPDEPRRTPARNGASH
jgi:hypothetical protein